MREFCVQWPYVVNYEKINEVETDVLIIGGGIGGSWAAITASKRGGVRVAVVDEMDIFSAGPAGCDHWNFAYDNPACKIKPDDAIAILERITGGRVTGISRYVTFNESFKTLLELEKLGAKIRDAEDEFRGAPFRDEETKLLYAYDYEIKPTIRVWGQTFRQALYAELQRLRVSMFSRVMVTSLLTEKGEQGVRVVGATGVNVRTGEFYVFKAKATVLCTGSRDGGARVWSYWGYCFNSLSSPSLAGVGHAMSFKAGAELAALDDIVVGFTRSMGEMPSYATGNPNNTWYPCTIVDAKGKEIPWIDEYAKLSLKTVEERVLSSMRGYEAVAGSPTWPPELYPKPASHYPTSKEAHEAFFERIKKGEYTLPFYADLPGMPEHERRAIFGLMVANEGKTWILYRNLTQAGFNPDEDMLQGYWFGAVPPFRGFLDPLELAYYGAGGGLVHDWDFKTNLEGLYVAGDACIFSSEHSGAAVTGRWAGAKAADYAKEAAFGNVNWDQVERERQRVYAPTARVSGIDWKELNVAICKVMRTYVNDLSNEEMLKIALKWLEEIEQGEANTLVARNPHELARTLETLSVLENAKLTVLCRLEKMHRPSLKGVLSVKLKEDGEIAFRELPPRWWLLPPNAPTYRENYEKHKPW